MKALQLANVSLSFGDICALDDVSLEIAPGEMIALTGRSGSGKSSLLNVASGIVAPDLGGVAIMGEGLGGLSAVELADVRARHVGFVFQNLNLLARLDVADNIALPLELRGTPTAVARAAAEAALETVDLDGRGSAMPAELSGGEQQRVAVARALVTGPSLVVADEPTAALDSVTADAVMGLVRSACVTRGAAALVVTHSPAQAAWADRVVNLRHGAIATSSTASEPPESLVRTSVAEQD